MPTCGFRLAAAEREREKKKKKVGQQEGEMGRNWRWASGLLVLRAERKGRGERWTGMKEEVAVWAKRGEGV
jgi:hypothetical protein